VEAERFDGDCGISESSFALRRALLAWQAFEIFLDLETIRFACQALAPRGGGGHTLLVCTEQLYQ
jgi:hypothetical protein